MCVYNFVAHNLMTDTMQADIYDADNPPESFVIMSMGTDTTDLVITNGFRDLAAEHALWAATTSPSS